MSQEHQHDQPSAASDTQSNMSSRDVFPFFDLPAELRNAIYEYATYNGEVRRPREDDNSDDDDYDERTIIDLAIFTVNGPRRNLLLVSQQFSGEYAQCVKKITFLEVQDFLASNLELPVIPPALRKCNIESVRLFMGEPSIDNGEFDCHDVALEQAQAQSSTRNPAVKLFLSDPGLKPTGVREAKGFDQWPHGVGHGKLKEGFTNLAIDLDLKELKLCYFALGRTDIEQVFEEQEHLIGTWMKGSGWKESS